MSRQTVLLRTTLTDDHTSPTHDILHVHSQDRPVEGVGKALKSLAAVNIDQRGAGGGGSGAQPVFYGWNNKCILSVTLYVGDTILHLDVII